MYSTIDPTRLILSDMTGCEPEYGFQSLGFEGIDLVSMTVGDMRVEGATVGLGTAEVKSISYKQRIHRLGFSNRQV